MTAESNQHMPKGIKIVTQEELQRHAYCLQQVAGYTILRNQVSEHDLQTYREICTKVLQEKKGGGWAASSLYCWGEEMLGILDHENIHRLASLVMTDYKLWNLSVGSPTPAEADGEYPPQEELEWYRGFHHVDSPERPSDMWHRDFDPADSNEGPNYLWFFICLVDVNEQNGGTWIAPGTNHISDLYEPNPHAKRWFPSAIQIHAKAGDILVLDPTTYHERGTNYTTELRLLLSVNLCRKHVPAAFNHWKIAGPLQQKVKGRVKELLKASEAHAYDRNPSAPIVLPEGWPVSPIPQSED